MLYKVFCFSGHVGLAAIVCIELHYFRGVHSNFLRQPFFFLLRTTVFHFLRYLTALGDNRRYWEFLLTIGYQYQKTSYFTAKFNFFGVHI